MCNGIELVLKIDSLLTEFKLSRKEFAKYLNLSPSTIATWKTKNILPPVETLDKIATYFNVSIEWLLTEYSYTNTTEYQKNLILRQDMKAKFYETLKQKNIKLDEFFKMIPDLTEQIIENWIKGRINISESIFKRITDFLGLSMDCIFGNQEKLEIVSNSNLRGPDTIELTESDRNIIRFCVEERYNQESEKQDQMKMEILKPILEKLKRLRKKELETGTNEKSIYL